MKTPYSPHPHIHEAIEAVLVGIEFCASPTRTLKEWEDDNVQLTATERGAVLRTAADVWARWTREARVAAISRD